VSGDRAVNAPGPADPPAVSAVAVLWVGSEKISTTGRTGGIRKAPSLLDICLTGYTRSTFV
jgi:hypothetical protein